MKTANLKKVLLALVGLVGLAVLGVAVIFFWARSILATETVRSALAGQISSALGQPVTIGGLGVSFSPQLSVQLDDVVIGDRRAITIERLRMATDLGAILSRRIEHATLRLTGAHIALPLPLFTVGNGPSPAAVSAPASPPPLQLVSVDEIVLKSVEITSGGRTLKGEMEVVPQGSGVLIKNVRLSANDTTLTATGRITDFAGPVGEIALTTRALNFDDLIAFATDFSSGSGMSVPASSAPPPDTRHIAMTIDADRATMGGMHVDHVAAHALVQGSTMTIDPLTFNLFGGRYEGALHVSDTTHGPTFRWTAAVSGVDVAAAAAFAGSPNTVSGRMNAKIDLLGHGADSATAMRTVRGSARIDVTDGIVHHLGLVRSVGAATSLNIDGLRRASAQQNEGTDEPFSRLGGTIVLADGTASTSDLQFDAEDLRLLADGTVRLDASAMNLKGRLELSESLSQEVHHALLRLSEDNGRVVLPATITGPVAEPVVRVDTADITKRALRNTATEQAPKLLNRLGGLIRK